MIRHHPDNDILLEYSAGTLPWAVSLAVSAHLQLCPQCRQQHQQHNHLGGELLDDSDPQQVSSDALQHLMARIDSSDERPEPAKKPQEQPPKVRYSDPALRRLPRIVRKLVDDNWPLRWNRVSPALKMSRLQSGQDHYEVAFHRICRGGKTAEHDHRGQEVVLVLYGSFSDADGVYAPGDFLVREPGEVHRPIATQDRECLCLSVVEAPVAVTGLLGWLVNPFLSFKPG